MIPSNLILGSDVVLKNLLVDTESGGTVNMSKYTLTLAGDSVYVNSKVVGILTTCTLISETADMPYLFLGADVHRLNIENDGVVFGADSHIVYCNDNKIYYQNDADVDVDFWD